MGKKTLPGNHGDSLDYQAINSFLIYMGVGIALGIVLFGFVL